MIELLKIVAAPFIAAVVAIAVPILQRKWKKDDDDSAVIHKLDELSKKMDTVEKQVTTLTKDVTKQKETMDKFSGDFSDYKVETENRLAAEIRVRILHADDELCNTAIPYPSEGYFEQIIQDCDEYEAHCAKRKAQNIAFKNGIADASISHIREVYKTVKAKRLFGEFK